MHSMHQVQFKLTPFMSTISGGEGVTSELSGAELRLLCLPEFLMIRFISNTTNF